MDASPPDLDLAQVLRSTPAGDGRFVLQVPDGWQQDRGAYGGLTLGALARAVLDCEPEPERALRSFTGAITGPVLPGAAEIEVQALRRGSGVSAYAAVLRQGGGAALAQATVVLGRPRVAGAGAIEHRFQPPPPARPPFSSLPVLPLGPPLGPPFTQHFEIRAAQPPFLGQPQEPIAAGWLRPLRPPAALEAPELIALADVWWPAIFAVERQPRPGGTIAFTAHLAPPARPLDPTRPLYHTARAVAAQDGFIVEHRELWSEDGALLVQNPQVFALIR